MKKIDKKTINTFAGALICFGLGIGVSRYSGLGALLLFLIGFGSILGWVMDIYFKKKYGTEISPLYKEAFKNPEGYVDQSPFGVQIRKIKGWFKK